MNEENTSEAAECAPEGTQGCSSDAASQQQSGSRKTCPPPHYQVLGEGADADSMSMFYMTVYKVALCPKPYSHDWGACPYAHEKENARRRDPLKFQYSSCICPNSGKGGECPNGLACQYSHTLFEYWLHPMRYRTQMCRSGASCNRSLCFFAHSQAELRPPCQPMVLLQRQQQQQQQQQSQQQPQQQQQQQIPVMGYGSLTAAASGVRPALSGYNVQLRSDVAGWPLTTDQNQGSSSAGQRAVLLGTAPNQLGGAQGVMYALSTAGDMSTSSSASSSGAVVLMPGGQSVLPATSLLSLPPQHQQQQQGVLRPSEYLLLQNHQWQQQGLPQVSANQLEALQLQLQQQPQQQMNVAAMAQLSSVPANSSMAATYIRVPAVEATGSAVGLASSNALYVQQFPQSYNLPLVGTEVVSAVSGGMCLPGI